jgi:hypothetical protein
MATLTAILGKTVYLDTSVFIYNRRFWRPLPYPWNNGGASPNAVAGARRWRESHLRD